MTGGLTVGAWRSGSSIGWPPFPIPLAARLPKDLPGCKMRACPDENVDDHLQIIEHDPLAGGKSVDRDRSHLVVFFQTRLDFTGNRFELRLGCGRANHKEIGERRDPAQIQHDDLFRLLVRGELGAAPG